MPLFLTRGKYNAEGAKGLLKEGGSKRRATVQQAVEKAGGKIHAFYYAFGGDDVYVITEFPDTVTAAAFSLAVNATDLVTVNATLLLTPEEVDAATKKTIAYRAPGG
jgi:uncharacterized protein with GYD domain